MTSDVIRSYNRDTAWLATGVLGAVALAALVLGVGERQPKATQAERNLLTNADAATVESVFAKSSNSNGKITSGSSSSVDYAFTKTPQQEIPSSQMEPAASTQIFAPAFTSQKIVTHLGKTLRKRQHQRPAMYEIGLMWRLDLLM